MRHSLDYDHKNEDYDHKKERLSQFNSTNSNNESRNFSRHTNFLICEPCFWCASYLYGPYEAEICPVCCNNKSNCSYKDIFERDQLGNIILDVYPNHKDSTSEDMCMLRSRRVYLY